MTYGSLDNTEKGNAKRVTLTDIAQKSQRKLQHASRSIKQQQQQPSNASKAAVFSQIFAESVKQSELSTRSNSSSLRTPHSWLYTMLNSRSIQPQAKIFKTFIATVIVVDMIFFVISTDPTVGGSPIFRQVEGTTSTIFLIEYLLRLCTVMESKSYREFGPITGRLRYAVTAGALVDALATFPFFIELVLGVQLPTLTYVRIFRLMRILKTEAYSRAFDALWRVFYYNREILSVAGLVCIFLIVLTAVLLYYSRPPNDEKGDFESIGATMYISTLMLTGQGGPDTEDLPWYTRIVVLLTGVFSIAVFAIPASMLTWGFEAEAERLAAASRRKRRDTLLDQENDESDWESDGSNSTDEEYMKIIAGEDDDDKPTEDEKIQMLLKVFQSADTDRSGGLNPEEFVQFLKENVETVSDLVTGRMGDDEEGDGGGGGVDTELRRCVRNLEDKVHAMDAKLDQLLAAVQK